MSSAFLLLFLLVVAGCGCDDTAAKQESASKPPPEASAPAAKTAIKQSGKSPRGDHQDGPQGRFKSSVYAAYLDGGCAEGSVAAARPAAPGIRVVVAGRLGYDGADLIIGARVSGKATLTMKNGRQVTVSMGTDKVNTGQFKRAVRGEDPMAGGDSRSFLVQSAPFNPGLCDLTDGTVSVALSLEATGVQSGPLKQPLFEGTLAWAEVMGMGIATQVQLKAGDQWVPANARMSRLDHVLVTRLDGTSGWEKRVDIRFAGGFKKGPQVSFPAVVHSDQWKVTVKGVSTMRGHADYRPTGEDESLVVYDVEIVNLADHPAKVGGLRLRLEVRPGEFVPPVAVELGRMRPDEVLEENASASGKLAFVRTRFMRPARLRVDLQQGAPLYVDVLDYSVVPGRLK